MGMHTLSTILKLGRNILYQFLRDEGVLKANNLPNADYVKYFRIKYKQRKKGKKGDKVTIVTREGVDFIIALVEQRYERVPYRRKSGISTNHINLI